MNVERTNGNKRNQKKRRLTLAEKGEKSRGDKKKWR